MDSLIALQEWLSLACDGDWEHTYGIRIETLDNPGWALRVDLLGTSLEGKHFVSLKVERDDNDWIVCRIEKNTFTGYGGTRNLSELIRVFTEWANSQCRA